MSSSASSASSDSISFIKATEDYVKSELRLVDSSHDWLHIERVRKNALDIANQLNATLASSQDTPWLVTTNTQLAKRALDLELVEMSALLHDIGDYKYSKSDTASQELIHRFLMSIHFPKDRANAIVEIVDHLSYRKELAAPDYFASLLKTENDPHFVGIPIALELATVQDADRLDAIGAIGIARCFSYGAVSGHPFYDPLHGPHLQMTSNEYNKQTLSNKGNPIHHCYEKLFKIKDRIKTTVGSNMAQQRHQFMIDYVRQFENEVGLTSYLLL